MKYQGSCALSIVALEKEDTIKTMIMGNAGYSLFHVDTTGKMQKYYHSEPKTVSFMKPTQIGSSNGANLSAIYQTHKIRENDIIMVYTDGFSDNVFKTDFPSCIQPYINSEGRLVNFSGAAVCLAVSSYELSK
jgi:hypothetical protein